MGTQQALSSHPQELQTAFLQLHKKVPMAAPGKAGMGSMTNVKAWVTFHVLPDVLCMQPFELKQKHPHVQAWLFAVTCLLMQQGVLEAWCL